MSLYVRYLFRWLGIIGLLAGALLLGGCSAVRLGYNNAPDLTYWWLDSYMDFDSPQSVRVRADLQALQDWHRKEELPQYAEFIKGLQPLVNKQVTSDQVCALYDCSPVRSVWCPPQPQ
jgi:dihydrodipicolinate synthase/N-acetylneuraminate lyase